MKSLLVKLGVILIGLAIFGYAEVWGEDWVFVGDYINYRLYYDAQSISRPSKNIFQISVKSEVSNEVKKRYENAASYSIFLYEFNCKEKIFRTLSLKSYSEDGELMGYRPWREEWLIIPNLPELISLYKIVCK